MFLRDILPNYTSKNLNYECKLILNDTKTINWLKTINGFANASGGIIFVGIEDSNGLLKGLSIEQIDKQKLLLYSQINQHFKISPIVTTETISFKENDKNKYILKVIVSESTRKPCIMTYEGMPMIFLKRDG